jgi:hypothetical protein
MTSTYSLLSWCLLLALTASLWLVAPGAVPGFPWPRSTIHTPDGTVSLAEYVLRHVPTTPTVTFDTVRERDEFVHAWEATVRFYQGFSVHHLALTTLLAGNAVVIGWCIFLAMGKTPRFETGRIRSGLVLFLFLSAMLATFSGMVWLAVPKGQVTDLINLFDIDPDQPRLLHVDPDFAPIFLHLISWMAWQQANVIVAACTLPSLLMIVLALYPDMTMDRGDEVWKRIGLPPPFQLLTPALRVAAAPVPDDRVRASEVEPAEVDHRAPSEGEVEPTEVEHRAPGEEEIEQWENVNDPVSDVASDQAAEPVSTPEPWQCVACMDASRQVVLPCGHVVLCMACFDRLAMPKRCPTCRASARTAQRVYF